MHWYYLDKSKRTGPLSDSQFDELVSAGQILPETLVWNESLTSWTAFKELRKPPAAEPVSPAAPVASPAPVKPASELGACSQCGNMFPRDELMVFENRSVCSNCKPLFVQRLKEGVSLPGTLRYAGFWIRFAGWFIDYLIQTVVSLIGIALAGLLGGGLAGTGMFNQQQTFSPAVCLMYILLVAFGIAYDVFFVGKFGATPGKMAVGLKIVTAPDGGRVSYLQALGRYFAKIVSALPLLIGFIMAAFDDEKRALHDRICNTRVILTRP